MSARTAFVTGVTGQTGSYLAEQLTASGHRVVGLVRGGDTTSRVLLARMPEITLIEGDLLDSSRLREIVLDVAPDVLYNLGGLTSVGA
ncbi:MAG: GDPmannose 4,6-dehydratase, partial [Actinomycetota bacterium]|nr:GDPmannose 4,6-dehydratase [Actinomycetota bacterium]